MLRPLYFISNFEGSFMSDLSIFTKDAPFVLIGCGNMGGALVRGWLEAGLAPEALIIIDPAATVEKFPHAAGARFVSSAEELPAGTMARVMMIAVKPQVTNAVLMSVKHLAGEGTLVISVAAGVTLYQLTRELGVGPHYVRAMPNTPAAVGAGVSGLAAEDGVPESERALAEAVMRAAGKTIWVANEGLINSVTATSGSGPAYVFHMVEALAAGSEKAGMPKEDAMLLARETIIGAARLLEASPDVPASTLRERVTSPAGTTAAALEVLMDSGELTDLMTRAVAAAKRRGEELAG